MPARRPARTGRRRRRRIETASLPPLTVVCVRSINPTLTLATTGTVDAGRCGEPVGIVRLITKPDPVLVEPAERLLEQRGLGVPCRHGAFNDIEAVFVHVHASERAGLVGVVREL